MKKDINEIYFLRCIACLSVVLLHSVSSAYRIPDLIDPQFRPWFRSFQLLLCFCTPTFVLISEFLISRSYSQKLPQNFYRKRVQSILLPYIFISIAYPAFELWNNNKDVDFLTFLLTLGKTMFLGAFHGYFVLIIFQFYLVHPLFQKYIYKKFPMRKVLLLSFLISFSYQVIFALIPVSSLYSRLLFPGWLVYFTVGFYAGKEYEWIKLSIRKYSKYLLPLIAACATFILFNYNIVGYMPVHSKRPDMLIYTIAMSAGIFYLATRIKRMPGTVITISGYSYGIYLLHPFFFRTFEMFLPSSFHTGTYSLLYISIAFVAAVVGSMGVIYILNQHKYGQYLVGRINIRPVRGEETAPLASNVFQNPARA